MKIKLTKEKLSEGKDVVMPNVPPKLLYADL